MLTLPDLEEAFNRLEPVVNKTPVFTSRTLNSELDLEIYFKLESFQRMGAFKFRGAYNALSLLSPSEKERGVVTHSSGNHAQAIALAGKLLKIKTIIVMPSNAPAVKKSATLGYGAEVVECKPTTRDREETCESLIKKHGYTLIHPYDNDNVIAGASTAVQELIKEYGKFDAVIAPVGGGGLLSGTALYSKLSGNVKRVFGAEPSQADDAYRSFHTNKVQPQLHPNTIADGLRTSLSERTFGYIKTHVDEIIRVDEGEIVNSMRFIWERMKSVVEPSGATSLAAVRNARSEGLIEDHQKIGLIISGGNVDLNPYFKIFAT